MKERKDRTTEKGGNDHSWIQHPRHPYLRCRHCPLFPAGKQRKPLLIFVAQLALNALWTPLFFGLHRPGLAFAEITLLWLAIAATIAAFRPVSQVAVWLLAPYLAWVSFAAALNFTLWRLNP